MLNVLRTKTLLNPPLYPINTETLQNNVIWYIDVFGYYGSIIYTWSVKIPRSINVNRLFPRLNRRILWIFIAVLKLESIKVVIFLSIQVPYKHTTCIPRWDDRFNVVSTWNTRGVFVGLTIPCIMFGHFSILCMKG